MTYFDETSFMHVVNESYIEEMYARFKEDPGSVDSTWAEFFDEMGDDASSVLSQSRGASWSPRETRVIGNGDPELSVYEPDGTPIASTPRPGMFPASMTRAPMPGGAGPDQIRQATLNSIRAIMLIRAYRVRGHLLANLDPLGLDAPTEHPELDPATYGFSEADMDRPIFINYVLGLETATIRDILKLLKQTYCGTIGIEFTHIQDPEQKAWIQERIESGRNHTDFTDNGKRAIYDRLAAADVFESYLDKKFTGTKRFGLDGGESLIPALEQVIKRGGQLGVREIVIGMAHRGRLNVLAQVMGKPFSAIFSEFQGTSAHPDDVQGSGDVKYHLGTSSDRTFDGVSVHLSLTANPSHLEVVDPVVLGKVRAKQRQRGDEQRDQVMGLILHGDAAFAGQGIVGECFDMSQLKGYRTGGTMHVVINNQIGFTTAPAYSRSSPYCSDVAKRVDAPIFHVNADDPEAVTHVARIATEYRQKFKWDVVIDMICYRRHGHNEGDEPAFTQPLMYRKIRAHPTTREIYARKLEDEGTFKPGEGAEIVERMEKELDQSFEAASGYKVNKADWLEGKWAGMGTASGDARRGDTAIERDVILEIGRALTETPQNFNLNPKIKRQLEAKWKAIESGEGIDWATGEAIAFGSLLVESTPVRLSGQDCGRGTFSQRHSVWIDQETEQRYVPLNHIRFGQAPYEVIDSPLSEAGILGFEYGYTLAEPNMLVLWEGQFGDFANGAQVIIDQFLSSGESKWLRMSGLVMLLPHGYEGQGPEHSSARPERYLQLCAEDNIQVCNVTTPAQYCHVLRRQIRRDFRKPLILMTPKSLLRHKACVSTLDDFGPGATFHRVMYDNEMPCADKDVRRVVLCTGKVYYDLLEERNRRGIENICFLRLEQLYPWPDSALSAELPRFKSAEIVWCQEEPENMGYWRFADRRLEKTLVDLKMKHKRPRYIGRPEAASPATGSLKRHIEEQKALVDEALTL